MLGPKVFSIAFYLFSIAHAAALPGAKTVQQASTLEGRKTPKITTHVSPDGYTYGIDEANAIKFSPGKPVAEAGLAKPAVSPNPGEEVKNKLNKRGLGDRCD